MVEIVWLGWVVMGVALYISIFWLSVYTAYREEIEDVPELARYPSISILIPAFNEEEYIGDCLQACLDLDYPEEKVEIIVVDDGSTDRTADVVEEYTDERITLIQQENQGKGGALNTALEEAENEIVVVEDADSELHPAALKNAVGYLEQENVAGVIASIKPLETRTIVQKLQKIEYMLGMLLRKLMAHLKTLYVTPGALSLYRREVVEAEGGFDEGNLTEDLEIALRLRNRGYDIEMALPAIARTALPATVRELFWQRMRWYRGLVQNTLKYREMLFNRDYGYLGTFQMPLHILFPFVVILSLGLLFYGIATMLYDAALYVSAVGFSLPPILPATDPYKFLLAFNLKVYFPLLVAPITVLALIVLGYRHLDEDLDRPHILILFFILYYTMLGVFWASAVVQEIAGYDQQW